MKKLVITCVSGLTALFLVGCTTDENYRTDSTYGTESSAREAAYRDLPDSTREGMNRPSDVYTPSRDPHRVPTSPTWPWQVQPH
jgi:hypothetical protein